MACCILGALIIGQALTIWRWLDRNGGKLLVGVFFFTGAALIAVGVVDMAEPSSTGQDTASGDICFSKPVVSQIQVLISSSIE